jgi:hypothetical protein
MNRIVVSPVVKAIGSWLLPISILSAVALHLDVDRRRVKSTGSDKGAYPSISEEQAAPDQHSDINRGENVAFTYTSNEGRRNRHGGL